MSACECDAAVHVQCLAAMFEGGYSRCGNCFAKYSPEAVLAAAKYMFQIDPSMDRKLKVVMESTDAGNFNESLSLLKGIDQKALDERQKSIYAVEYGAACLAAGDVAIAVRNLEKASHAKLQSDPIRTLALLGLALTEKGKLTRAQAVLSKALKACPRSGADSLKIMLMLAASRLCLAREWPFLYKDTMLSITQLADISEPNPTVKAIYQAQLGIGEYMCGEDSSERLRGALRELRRRDQVFLPATDCLAQQVKFRRLRRKTHVETI